MFLSLVWVIILRDFLFQGLSIWPLSPSQNTILGQYFFQIHLALVGVSTFLFLFVSATSKKGDTTERQFLRAGALLLAISGTGVFASAIYSVLNPQSIELLQISFLLFFAVAVLLF